MLEYSAKHVTWRIEAKPEGGFIARHAESPDEVLEADTREEIQAKVRERLKDLMGPECADLDLSKLPLDQPGSVVRMPPRVKFSFSLGTPGDKPKTVRVRLPGGPSDAIQPGGGSLLSAMWKAAVLVGIALIIWLLLHRS